jgi:hypothetical protein
VGSRDLDVDTILSRYKTDLAKARVSLEKACQRMIKAARGSPNAFEYKVGDLVKIYLHVLLNLRLPARRSRNSSLNSLVLLK